MLLQLLYHAQLLCDRVFLNAILANLVFFVTLPLRLKYAWDTLLYFNIVWE
jgi:hypothetical protein